MLRIFFRHFFLAVALLSFFWPQFVFAADSPGLVSPLDNVTEDKSPKLTWEFKGECVESGSCFRVEVDNSSDFSSPEKSTYTNSFSYSPQGLPDGLWNWRVKARDKTDTWSDWSRVFKFTIGGQSAAAPSPSSSPQSTSQATPAPSAASKSENIFNIKDLPAEINSNQDVEISVSLKLPDKANTRFYLKGAFKKSDSSNYFAQTYVNNSRVKNNSSYASQFKIETDKDGKWEGKIKVRADTDDSGFDGTGDYVFKVGRYTDTGSGPSWSNELGIKINAVDIPEPLPSEEPEEAAQEDESDQTTFAGSIVKAAAPKNYEIKIASVAGEATISDNMPLVPIEEQTRVLEEKKINWLLIGLGAAVLVGGIGFTFYRIRKKN